MIVLKLANRPTWLTKAAWNRALKTAWAALGDYWHAHFRHRHFDRRYMEAYGYTRRTRAYEKRKQRLKGHRNPLVWSGSSRTLTRVRNVRPTRRGVKIVMNAPRLNYRRLARELTTVLPEEIRILTGVFDAALETALSGGGPTTVARARDIRGRFVPQ